MKIAQLKLCHLRAPLGFQVTPLSFTWKVTDCTGTRQRWARVRVFQGQRLLHDSGPDQHADGLDYALDLPLQPRTAYRWQVEVLADNGEHAAAESTFETGKMGEGWTARWITPTLDPATPAVLRRRFQARREAGARLYICGLGLFEAYLNGEKVGDEYLAPGYHAYDFHVQVHTYDVTGLLRDGENELSVWLADGWYRGRLGFEGGYTDLYGDRCYCIAELYAGERLLLATDESWQCRPSPVTFSNIYDGEIFDANMLASLSWDEDWSPVRDACRDRIGSLDPALAALPPQERAMKALCDRVHLPIVKKESFRVAQTIHTPKGETVLDFGQELAGWIEFDAHLPAGTRVRLTSGEILQHGCFYRDNYRTARSAFTYISDGQARHVRPHFTFFGFRYALVEYLDRDGTPLAAHAPLENVTAWHLRSDFDQIGTVHTGLEKVNRLFENALWGQKDNFLDVPTDCPQRDERLGWTGDAQVFSDTACFNMFMPAFYRKYLWDMRSEQSILGGSVPNVVPRLKQGMVAEHGSSPWGDAGVVIPWNVWLHYGSRTLLAECYPGMKAWVDCQRRRDEAVEGPHLIKDGFHFADWLALDDPAPGPFGATDPLYIASAYYFYCARAVAQAAEILGYDQDAQRYGALARDIRAAILRTYFGRDGLCLCRTQTGSAVAVMFGLSPDPAAEGAALLERVRENNTHLNTGFVGTTLLCPALSEGGHHRTAVDLLLNEDFPSWLYSVNLGATTIWERWDSVLPDGTISPEGMNSLNHYSYGSIVAWMYRYLLGLSPLEPGFRRARIAPCPDRRLSPVHGSLDTPAGRYSVRWSWTGTDFQGEVEVPFNAEAELVWNGTTIRLTAGTHRFGG